MNPNKNEYTYEDYLKHYPNDDACLQRIYDVTYGTMDSCPRCGYTKKYHRVKGRKAFQCGRCRYQVHPMKGTAFESTKLPLSMWFYTIFSFSISKNGLAAHELSRAFRISQKSALRMLKVIREHLVNDESPLSGVVQIDETFVGGKNRNRHYNKKYKYSQGRSYKDKVPVVGMIEVVSGRAIAKVVENVQRKVLHPLLLTYIERGSVLQTDEYRGYNGLEQYYERHMCNHSRKQFLSEDGNASTNKLENLWSCLKRTLGGSYIKVSKKYLSLYVAEAIFRYNNITNPNIFGTVVSCMIPSSPLTI